MRILVLLLLLLSCIGYSCHEDKAKPAQVNDTLNATSNASHSYQPGLGEFMSGIQVHHAKLWFAGQNKNWELAHFEISEIKETLEEIQEYCADRPEIKAISMIEAPVNSVDSAINEKNGSAFNTSYQILTNTCNSCHKATNHGFNVIRIPTDPPFSNQDYKVH